MRGRERDNDDGKPPMEMRPVYVEYVAVRRCRYNPSWERALTLPRNSRSDLWRKYTSRAPEVREMPKRLDLSRPPNQKSDEE
jgi:hypothetical protein